MNAQTICEALDRAGGKFLAAYRRDNGAEIEPDVLNKGVPQTVIRDNLLPRK